MPAVKGKELFVIVRIIEYCGAENPWNRALWACSAGLHLREVLEAARAVQEAVLSEAALANLRNAATEAIGPDHGVGSAAFRDDLRKTLKAHIRPGSIEYFKIEQTAAACDRGYLARWAGALDASPDGFQVESLARSVAAYLLDRGHGAGWITSWFGAQVFRETSASTNLSGLFRRLDEETARPLRKFHSLLPLREQPVGVDSGACMNGDHTAKWITAQGGSTSGLRIAAAIRLEVSARDEWAAAVRVRELVDTLLARSLVGTRAPLQHLGCFWVEGNPNPVPVVRPPQGARIRSVGRENRVVVFEHRNPRIDDAISLLGTLDRGPPGPALATGWAAAESLLIAPSESGDHVRAAERMAAIAACSFPRAELTKLAYSHEADDETAERIAQATSNRDRAEVVARCLRDGGRLSLKRLSDQAAQERMIELLDRSGEILPRVQRYHGRALRRFYRQRNMILHGAMSDGIATLPALRTAAPLVGAAVDRIHHAWANEGIEPVALAARAERNLALVNAAEARPITRLLEPLEG